MILTKIALMAVAIVMACYGTVTERWRRFGPLIAAGGVLLFFIAMLI